MENVLCVQSKGIYFFLVGGDSLSLNKDKVMD
jgi:hypothetical protein